MEIKTLIKEREALDAQITDAKTAEVRALIEELENELDSLRIQRDEAKIFSKSEDITIAEKIGVHREKISELAMISHENLIRPQVLENQMVRLASQLTDARETLKSLVATV